MQGGGGGGRRGSGWLLLVLLCSYTDEVLWLARSEDENYGGEGGFVKVRSGGGFGSVRNSCSKWTTFSGETWVEKCFLPLLCSCRSLTITIIFENIWTFVFLCEGSSVSITR